MKTTRLLTAICFTVTLIAQSYDYDAAGRLIRVAYPAGGGLSYEYDESDNMTRATVLNLAAAPGQLQLAAAEPSGFRLSWQAVPGVTTYAVFRSAGETGAFVEITRTSALSFLDNPPGPVSGGYSYRVAAVTSAGLSAWSAIVSTAAGAGPVDPRNSRSLLLEAGGARSFSTTGLQASTAAGYAKLELQSGEAPYGLAVFQLTQNGVVVGETGVPATPPSRASRIFIEHRTGVRSGAGQFTGTVDVNTGIAFVNPGEEAANFQLTFRDGSGRVVAAATGTMNPGRHTARLINEFGAIAPGFALPPGFAEGEGYGTLDIESDRPLSVLALRLTVNQRGDLLFSTTTVADLQQPPPTSGMYFAHVPEGGGFNSKIALMSSSANTPQTGVIRLLDDNGAPFRVRTVDGQTAAEFAYTVPPGGSFVLETDGSLPTVAAGWAIVTPTPGQTVPAGSGTFRFVQGGMVTTESGIPPATPTTRARVYADSANGHATGLALANPSATNSTRFTIRAVGLDGSTPVGTAGPAVAMNPLGHTAGEAERFVAGLPREFIGILEIESAEPFIALTVRSLSNARRDLLFTTFPVADQTRPAPAPVIFPHLADGGGFRTELILLNPAGPASSLVRLYDSAGQPLNALP